MSPIVIVVILVIIVIIIAVVIYFVMQYIKVPAYITPEILTKVGTDVNTLTQDEIRNFINGYVTEIIRSKKIPAKESFVVSQSDIDKGQPYQYLSLKGKVKSVFDKYTDRYVLFNDCLALFKENNMKVSDAIDELDFVYGNDWTDFIVFKTKDITGDINIEKINRDIYDKFMYGTLTLKDISKDEDKIILDAVYKDMQDVSGPPRSTDPMSKEKEQKIVKLMEYVTKYLNLSNRMHIIFLINLLLLNKNIGKIFPSQDIYGKISKKYPNVFQITYNIDVLKQQIDDEKARVFSESYTSEMQKGNIEIMQKEIDMFQSYIDSRKYIPLDDTKEDLTDIIPNIQ